MTMPRLITLEEALAMAKADPNTPTLEQLRADHDECVKEADELYGPHVSSFFLHLIPKPLTDSEIQRPRQSNDERLREPDMTFEDAIRSGMVAMYLDYGTSVFNRIAQSSRV